MTKAKYRGGQYNSFSTSYEVLQAIEELTNSDLLDDGSDAVDLWTNGDVVTRHGSTVTCDDVERVAWSLADSDETVLHWGQTKIKR